MGVCPEDASWQRWLDGDAARDERAAMAGHLSTCDACCGFVAALDPDAVPGGAGARIDRYQLIELLGAGAMGLVYEAYDPRLERRVAVKLLRPPGSPDERAALSRRMWREACAMAQLSHPNVVTVHDVGMVDTKVFIAMELVRGQSLSAWCRTGAPTLAQRVAVLAAAGDGLAAIHGAGLLHRDFKPDNVLIDHAGRVRVTDFGVAAALGDAVEREASLASAPTLLDRLTLTRSLVGTPAYMAPEQLDGVVADARADQFGFCVTLYECVFGGPPFAGTTVLERRAAIEAGAIQVPARRDRAARQVLAVVRRGLDVDPAARYPSMRALLAELRQGQRAPRRGWAAAVAVAAVVAAGGAYHLGRETGPVSAAALAAHGPRPAIAVLGLRTAGLAGDGAWLGGAVSELLIAELAGDDLRLTRGEDVARARADGVVPAAGELPSPGPALERARATFAVDLFLVGSYVQSEAGVRINLGLRDARSGALRWQATEDGPLVDLTATVARAATSLRRQLQVGADGPTRDPARRAALPATPAALQAYTEGVEASRRSDQVTALQRLTAAAALDPDSAAIQLALAEVYDNSGQYQRRQEVLARAFALSRHADREQQLAVEARYRAAMGETARAVELYQSLTTFFPDDPGYGYQLIRAELTLGASRDGLAVIERMREQPGRADDPWLDVLEGDVRRELGDLDGAERVLLAAVAHADRAMARAPQARALLALGWTSIQRGQFALARDRARAVEALARAAGDRFTLFHGLELAGRAEMFLGDLAAAEDDLAAMVAEMEALTFRTGFGYNMRAWIQLERGELRAAAAGLDVAFRMNADTGSDVGVSGTLLPAIELALATGRTADADRMADWLQRIDEHSSSPLQAARYQWMRALVLAAHGRRAEAATTLSAAATTIDFAPSYAAELRLDLARVYLADRDWERAATTAGAVARAFAAMGARDLEAGAEAVLARAKAGSHAPVEADAALARALALAAASESPLTRLAIDLARGRVLESRGGDARRRGRALVQATNASAQRQGLRGLVEAPESTRR